MIPPHEDRLNFRNSCLVQLERAHASEQTPGPIAKGPLLNLNGHERREEQTNNSKSDKSQNLPLEAEPTHLLMDTNPVPLVPKCLPHVAARSAVRESCGPRFFIGV